MQELFSRKNLLNLLIIPVFALGRLYEDRLSVGGFNFSIFFTFLYVIALFEASKRLSKNPVSVTLFLFLSLLLCINSINWIIWGAELADNYSLNKLLVLVLITFPICLYVSTFDSEEKVLVFLKQLSLVGFFLAIIGTMKIIQSGGMVDSRLAVLGGGPIVFGRWIGLVFLTVLFGFSLKKIFKIPVLAILLLLIIFTGSKGPFLFLVLTIILIRINNIKSFLFVLILASLVLYNLSEVIDIGRQYSFLSRTLGLEESSSLVTGSSSTKRISLIQESISGMSHNLFGYGLGNYEDHTNTAIAYPHNFFFELFFEVGIIAIIVFIIFGILIFRSFKLLFSQNTLFLKEYRLVTGVWLFYFLNSMVSGDLSDSRFLIVFTVLFFTLNRITSKANRVPSQPIIFIEHK